MSSVIISPKMTLGSNLYNSMELCNANKFRTALAKGMEPKMWNRQATRDIQKCSLYQLSFPDVLVQSKKSGAEIEALIIQVQRTESLPSHLQSRL